jgi:hypothetical protein
MGMRNHVEVGKPSGGGRSSARLAGRGPGARRDHQKKCGSDRTGPRSFQSCSSRILGVARNGAKATSTPLDYGPTVEAAHNKINRDKLNALEKSAKTERKR